MTDKIKIDFVKKDKKESLQKDYDISYDFSKINQIIRTKRVNLANKAAIRRLVTKLLGLGLVIYIIFSFVFGIHTIYDEDMFPKFVPSDLVIYYRLDRDFHQGDVVAIHKDGKDYILRVVASGPDEVDISNDNRLMVNGAYQAESKIFYQTGKYDDTQVDIFYPLKLKEGEYFLLADMREGGKDSRYFGKVKKEEIKGKVFALYRRSDF